MTEQQPFSADLEKWLKSNQPKTFAGLSEAFAEKSFALAFLILLSFSALPLPTGGLTNVFEIIAMLLSLELVVGRKSIWLPKRWRQIKLGDKTQRKAIPFLIRRVRWFERFARPRLSSFVNHQIFRSLIGMVVFLLCLAAFLSPPFSGLDTLPSLGVVIISLGLILEDMALAIIGILIGATGVALTIGLGTAITTFLTNLLY
jgi:hypothetical protein